MNYGLVNVGESVEEEEHDKDVGGRILEKI